MRRHRQPRHGEGTAWLVVDRITGDYLCYWYTGTGDGHLVEQARAASAEEAVAWGRQRTPLVRIRTTDAATLWAGTGPRPEGFARSWTQDDPANEPAGRRPAIPSPSRDKQIRPAEQGQMVGVGPAQSEGPPC
jgi:hypothetical protein